MKEQLDRIEENLAKLTVAVEHRLTMVETTQRGIKWFICVVTAAVIAIGIAIVRSAAL
jgi:hypothetical protein